MSQAGPAERIAAATLEAVYVAAPLGLAVLDERGMLRQPNDQLQQLLGYSVEELEARSCADVTHPGDVAVEFACFDALLAGERDRYQLRKRLVHRGGTLVWVRQTVYRHRSADGASVTVLAVEDVTGAHGTEARLREVALALNERVKELTTLHQAAHTLIVDSGSRGERLRRIRAAAKSATAKSRVTHSTASCSTKPTGCAF